VVYWEDMLTGSRYHYLNHHTIFGGGYRSSAVSIMGKLNKKYGHVNS
jgi:hypothetical protein